LQTRLPRCTCPGLFLPEGALFSRSEPFRYSYCRTFPSGAVDSSAPPDLDCDHTGSARPNSTPWSFLKRDPLSQPPEGVIRFLPLLRSCGGQDFSLSRPLFFPLPGRGLRLHASLSPHSSLARFQQQKTEEVTVSAIP